MSKHIVDGPRKRDDSERLERYSGIERGKSGKPGPQSEALQREKHTRNPGEKLKRFTDIERRED